ncbi:MAG: 30S ribosomal protein S6 [Candidatus Sungiibacteriota bacterium]
MDSDAKNYEVAYLLAPSMTDEEALAHAGKLSVLIEGENGIIRHLETPKKRKLMYAVKKQNSAYFAWTVASISPDAVQGLNKKISAIPEVLRAMIVEHEVETRQPYIRPLAPHSPASISAPRIIPREEQKPDEKLDLEALDKRLEEILGK